MPASTASLQCGMCRPEAVLQGDHPKSLPGSLDCRFGVQVHQAPRESGSTPRYPSCSHHLWLIIHWYWRCSQLLQIRSAQPWLTWWGILSVEEEVGDHPPVHNACRNASFPEYVQCRTSVCSFSCLPFYHSALRHASGQFQHCDASIPTCDAHKQKIGLLQHQWSTVTMVLLSVLSKCARPSLGIIHGAWRHRTYSMSRKLMISNFINCHAQLHRSVHIECKLFCT